MMSSKKETLNEAALDIDRYGGSPERPWLGINWQTSQRSLNINGSRLNFVDIGSGEPLLLIHGLSASWQVWLETIPHFMENYRVIAPDLPGFGTSDMPSELITIDLYADTLADLLKELEIDQAYVVGNSMGGLTSARFAVLHPELVKKLVLVDPAGVSTHNAEHTPLVFGGKLLYSLSHTFVKNPGFIVNRSRARQTALGIMTKYPDLLPRELCFEMIKHMNREGFKDALKSIFSTDLRESLSQIEAETLVMWGDSDGMITPRDAYVFTELIPNSRLYVLEDTGHVPQVERPGRFNYELEQFLAG